jgi:glycosyltransferase involved in cell wall biosynthesis
MPDLSVIICTHNPRADYLRRVLGALRVQTLTAEQWELLLVDNASRERLAGLWDLSWHPQGRIIREDETGLTPARLRGIRESSGEILVFVDDDNVLAADYLANAVKLAATWPMLGAFGASISGEFEVPPPDWITPYLECLAIRELDRDYWCNLGGLSSALPCGAGLCVRRRVASDYLRKALANPFRKMLDRSGVQLNSGGDSDFAQCAVDVGLGTGRFTALRLVHLIPESRLTADYIIRLYAGLAASEVMLSFLRPKAEVSSPPGWENEVRFLFNYLRATGIQKKIFRAAHRARKQARQLISTVPSVVQDEWLPGQNTVSVPANGLETIRASGKE